VTSTFCDTSPHHPTPHHTTSPHHITTSPHHFLRQSYSSTLQRLMSLSADRSVLRPSGDDGQHLQVNGGVPALKKRTGNNSATRSGSKSGEACPLLLLGCTPFLFFLAASLSSSSWLQACPLLLGCKLAEQTLSPKFSASFCQLLCLALPIWSGCKHSVRCLLASANANASASTDFVY